MSYSATEPATVLAKEAAESNVFPGQSSVQYFFSRQEIQHLLQDTEAVGLRIHLAGYISPAPAIAVPARWNQTEIYDASSRSYLKVNNTGYSEQMRRDEFEVYLPNSEEQNAQHYCAFFSRSVLTSILNEATLVPDSGVHIFSGTYDDPIYQIQYPTLIAVASDGQAPIANGTFFRSELPCPPHCGGGTDYGSGWQA